MKKTILRATAGVFAAALVACGGGSNLPNGSVVNSPGGGGHPPTKLVQVKVTVTIPRGSAKGMQPGYVSPNSESLAIQLVSVDGGGVTGVNASILNTTANARGCKPGAGSIVCTGNTMGSPGQDVFSVTTYSATNATGSVLAVGSVQAKIAGNGGNVTIDNSLLTLDGVIASLKLSVSPSSAKRGTPTNASVSLAAYDATGAQIVGPSRYASPVALTIQGDAQNAFSLHAGGKSGASLTIVKPTSHITLSYDGNPQASPVSLQASVNGPSGIGASANFDLRGKQPPPPVGTIYALNLGANDGLAATVTEYDGKAKGNAAPVRTLQLSSKLYARTIAVDSNGNLYVGYFDNEFGHGGTGLPDGGNEIAIYASGASGSQQPTALLTQDKSTKTALFPVFIAFDPAGDLVTYGSTGVDGNGGNDAVLTYPPNSKGAASPAHGFDFASPTITYAGPTGLALDASGNVYVNGALHTSLGPNYGLYVASASDIGNPAATPKRTIPWNDTTELTPGLTTLVALDAGGEVLIGNSLLTGSGSSASCQGRANVFAAGASSGSTDVSPLRILTLDGIFTSNPLCASSRDPRNPFFPSIAIYATTLFVADDFNNAIAAFPAGAHGTVKPSLTIAGAATGLDAPIALVITSVSGRATARPVSPLNALTAR